jgi:3-oxoacyl-[acyl-carrier protein] reductase
MFDAVQAHDAQPVDANLKGPFLCSQLASRHMLDQEDGGTILNIGSSTGIRGRRNGVNTCASKAALMMMTQCLALELGPKVRVNSVVPGMTLTEDTERRFGLHDPAVRRSREELCRWADSATPKTSPTRSC